jgi:hypothetical protein
MKKYSWQNFRANVKLKSKNGVKLFIAAGNLSFYKMV